ncbi:nitroreductase family protein [Desulfoluna spongiiphila]|uniref:Nitroreductase n=1 Tax=Desulfoluna spongiiphila TaxID=419481 RepID=A0A1G5DW88_9BACT|nr:nitroreductase family protein [Desulfoluna spongiiphila]SCY18857.1 Nitroreductase [Desulfoluna spongiiphila]
MNYHDLLMNRRSVRDYEDRPVPHELIESMIRESTLAPSAGNGQPWEFIVVHRKEMLRRISDESKKNILSRIAANPDDYAGKYQTMLENDAFNVFYNAPCLVMVLGRSGLKNLHVDCALAASYFMMAATRRGLGTCWVNLGTEIKAPDMIRDLGIPEDSQIVAPIIIGYPTSIPSAPRRNEPNIIKVIV